MKFLIYTVSLLLVPCLATDSLVAAGLPEVSGQMYRSQIYFASEALSPEGVSPNFLRKLLIKQTSRIHNYRQISAAISPGKRVIRPKVDPQFQTLTAEDKQ